jgi:hypothetical protein
MFAPTAGHSADSRFEREAFLFAEMLRSTRLVLLYGEADSGKSQLLTRWLVPLLEQGDAERVVYFDAWDGAPLAALNARIERRVTLPVPARADAPLLSKAPWVERLQASTQASGRSLLVIFDHFERFLAAPVDDGIEEFERQWIAALATPDLRVNFLVALRSDAEPAMMARFQGRIAALGDNRLVLPPLHRRRASDDDVIEDIAAASSASPLAQTPAVPPRDTSDDDRARFLDDVPVHGEVTLASATDPGAGELAEPEFDDADDAELDEAELDEPELDEAELDEPEPDEPALDEPVKRAPPVVGARAKPFKRDRAALRIAVYGTFAALVVAGGWFLHERNDPAPQVPQAGSSTTAKPAAITRTPVRDAEPDGVAAMARELGRVLAAANGVAHPLTIRASLTAPVAPNSAATPALTIVRYDVLDAMRTAAAGPDPRVETLRLVLPLHVDPLYFVVRKDDRLAYVHEIAGLRINVGAGGSDAAVGASHLYQRLFDTPPSSGQVSYLPDAAALDALLRERSVDVVILAGRAGVNALFAQQRATPNAFKLLAVERGHPASRRALRSYLPIDVPPLENTPWLDRNLPALGVMSFLVTQARNDDLAGPVVRALCDHVQRLRQLGYPSSWRDVGVSPVNAVGWRYAGAADTELRACEKRRATLGEEHEASAPAKPKDPASTVSRLFPGQGGKP